MSWFGGTRGRLILSMLESSNENEEDSIIGVSNESSPAPSLTELKALDPDFVNNILHEGIGDFSGDHFNLEENLTAHETEQGEDGIHSPAEIPNTVDHSIEEVHAADNYVEDPTFIPETASASESSTECESLSGSEFFEVASPETHANQPEVNTIPLVPYSNSDTEDDESTTNTSTHINKGKKRVRNEIEWKKNKRKTNRLSGKQYINSKKNFVNEKCLKPACPATCRLKCNQRITEGQRLQIHSEYWNSERTWDLKRQFVVSCIKSKPVVRKRERDGSRKAKNVSHSFTFSINCREEVVCKTFFLNTLSISETFMRYALTKVNRNGLVIPDLRGKHVPGNKIPEDGLLRIREHISKFPMYESHYSRERSKRKYLGNHLNISKMYSLYREECHHENIKPEKSWVYSKIFNEEFNLSFHTPDNDTCDVCDKLDCSIKNEKQVEKLNTLKEEKQNHLNEASLRYELKRQDKVNGRETQGSRVIMSDLQKCLPTPDLKNSQSFYSRKLWTLNSTIYDTTIDKTWCMIWDEVTAGRGGNEIASCLFTWANEAINNPDNPTKTLTVWTDNCSGQNRNSNMIFMYLWMLKKIPSLQEINHKFLLAGHTHMEVDGKHSMIERAKKQLKAHTIYTTNDWANFIASCSKKNPFVVRRMGLEDFRDFLYLRNKNGPFVSRKTNTVKEPFLISNAVWLQLRQGESKFYYKTNFSDEDFKTVELKRRQREQRIVMPTTIPKLRETKKKISTEKYRDLMNLLQWVPEEYKSFFQNLPHGEKEGNFPEDDSTSLE